MTDARGDGTESDKPAPPAASPTPYGPYPGPYPPPYGSYPPPPPYGAGYPPSAYGGYPAPPPRPAVGSRNGLGVAALVLAIIGLVLTVSVVGGIVLGVLAVVIGAVARGRCKRGEADNMGIATSGIVLGAIAVLVSIAFIWVWVGVGQRWFDEFGGPEYMDCMQRAGSDHVAQQQCEDALRKRVEGDLGVTPTPTR
ncbi:DUF4190 domain-containing protein [Mycolicibacterium brisbanense]|uniref:DUF4190 domain-containing protein n=1 Tax=Mycolicibacterium brisbanense TaxID=146020 RepID=A0A100VXH1_9MYCO|nr:DUF4190 domain-containing protein [Mycolicibacterium brisbanense]MCV7161258.1 DUF4190 domain-containing protein [Mycolicibacterium brisbanense]GAS87819.1 uncharacterized protein RMCB_1915 [Mycolicibacterium brisbanense]